MREKTQLDLELSPQIRSLPELAKAESACTRCPLYKNATQAVPGEGRRSAHVMLVGEQPGDKEDLSGKPFVGPAGHVLDRALADAGIPRAEVFVTNAVKHFKHEMRGKRRLHKQAARTDLASCRRHRRLRHHPPFVPAAHRGRCGQRARVCEFRRRFATGGEGVEERGGLSGQGRR